MVVEPNYSSNDAMVLLWQRYWLAPWEFAEYWSRLYWTFTGVTLPEADRTCDGAQLPMPNPIQDDKDRAIFA